MSDFYKRFLMEDARRLNSETGRYIALAAFGKHPGWDDHIEDLGLETDSLILARKVLYVEGVGGQIDTGAWEKLKEEHRLAVFNHTFVWSRGDQFLIGRMWSSSDGKGRTRYPMIVCAHCVGASLGWALDKVLPRLMEVEKACQETKSAGDVRAILGQARNVLRNMVRDPEAEMGRRLPQPDAIEKFVSAPEFGPAQEGWFRILYWLQSQAGSFDTGRFSLKGDLSGLRAQQVRVPSGAASPTESAALWARFLGSRSDRLVPVLLVWPADGNWMDVTLGEPTTQEFFCLRASREAVALATDIPYDFDQKFREHAAQQLSDFKAGRAQRSSPEAAEKETPPANAPSATQRWFKSLGGKFFIVAVLLIAVAAVAVVVLKSGGGSKTGDAGNRQAQSTPSADSAPPATIQPQTSVKLRETEETAPAVGRLANPPANSTPTTAPKPKLVAESKPADSSPAKPDKVPMNPMPSTPASTEKPAAISDPAPVAADSRDKIITNGAGMVMLWVEGLPGSGAGGWVGRCEVRQAEYQKVIGSNPSRFVDPEEPVENVSWQEATEFCRKLSADEQAAGRLPAAFVYSLPTQKQWDFFLGNASFDGAVTSRERPALRTEPVHVGTTPPNQFGLFDVLGNVWEWCADSDSPDHKISKGGAFNNGKVFQFKPLEPTTTRRFPGDTRSAEAGFRCVLVQR